MTTYSGPVFRPGDEGYDSERAGYNLVLDHHPELVVGATGPDDVVAAVGSASAVSRAVGLLATGHGPSVPADGAVLINTQRMNGVQVDPTTRTARIEAGVRWQQVLAETVPHGLAPLNGSSPTVGAIGYLLGGGIGHLGRRYGFAADHVRGMDVVTADGQLRHVTADDDSDLFWALRGTKDNFGVVVATEIDLMPVSRLFGGGLFFGDEPTAGVLHTYREWVRTVPDELSSSVMLMRFPDFPAVPEPLRGRFVTHVRIAYCGSSEDGERWVEPLRAVGPRLMDTLGEMPYSEVGSIHNEPTMPVPFYGRAGLLRDLDAEAVDTLLSLAGPETNPGILLEMRHLGGAYSRMPAVPNPVGGRDAAFTMYSASVLQPGQLVEDVRPVHDGVHQKLGQWSTGGTFFGFLGVDDVTPEQVRTAFTPNDYARLTELKTTYDPDNMFRINHNIAPVS